MDDILKLLDSQKSIDEIFEIVVAVGKGAYGAVSKAKVKHSGDVVALKLVKRDKLRNGFPENAIREIKILRSLTHPNIIKLRSICTCKKDKDVYLVFDYCPYDLQGLIEKYKSQMGKPRVVCYFRQILQAIYYCHCHYIYHRDIKPSNIFVQLDNVIRMGDFGLARVFPPQKGKHSSSEDSPWNVVTIWYRSPELLLGAKEYGPEIDVWSLGCVLYEMITGEVLFKSGFVNGQESPEEQLRIISEKCGRIDRLTWPDCEQYQFYKKYEPILQRAKPEAMSLKHYLEQKLSEEYSQAVPVITGMLEIDPKKRMTIKEAFLHEFMASPSGVYDPQNIENLRFDEIHAMKIENNQANQQNQPQPGAEMYRPNQPKLWN